MYRFHIKSVVLGIGIGMILTSLTGIIYSAGITTEMSRDEIMAKARDYGMVEADDIAGGLGFGEDFFSGDNKKAVNIKDNAPDEDANMKDTDAKQTKVSESDKPADNNNGLENTASGSKMADEKINLKINKGDYSQDVALKLLNAGLIDDPKAFSDRLDKSGLAGAIQIGDYTFIKGTGMDEIIETITKR